MDITKIVGIIAGIFTGASMFPQVIKMIKEKKASQVSVFMLLILVAGLSLWIWYGFLKEDWPIIVTNLFSLSLNLIMIFLRYKYRNNKS
ncbi:MAG: SemiSWEET transporter [Chitinophagaceae bacterium]|nr:SemiSWEET transporter [Chitinophagaceae bacterium]